jgi:hypothetical protein
MEVYDSMRLGINFAATSLFDTSDIHAQHGFPVGGTKSTVIVVRKVPPRQNMRLFFSANDCTARSKYSPCKHVSIVDVISAFRVR